MHFFGTYVHYCSHSHGWGDFPFKCKKAANKDFLLKTIVSEGN